MPRKTNSPAAVKGSNHPGLIFAQAKQQIAQAATIDQVNDIRKRAMALAAYALQANKRQLKEEAEAIRMMAERRIGQMMQEQKKTVGLNTGTAGRGRPGKAGFQDTRLKKMPARRWPRLASTRTSPTGRARPRQSPKTSSLKRLRPNGQRRGSFRAKRRRPQRRSRTRSLAWSINASPRCRRKSSAPSLRCGGDTHRKGNSRICSRPCTMR